MIYNCRESPKQPNPFFTAKLKTKKLKVGRPDLMQLLLLLKSPFSPLATRLCVIITIPSDLCSPRRR